MLPIEHNFLKYLQNIYKWCPLMPRHTVVKSTRTLDLKTYAVDAIWHTAVATAIAEVSTPAFRSLTLTDSSARGCIHTTTECLIAPLFWRTTCVQAWFFIWCVEVASLCTTDKKSTTARSLFLICSTAPPTTLFDPVWTNVDSLRW